MSAGTIATAILWGIVSGYLVIRIFDCLAAFSFCLHARLKARWDRSSESYRNQVNPKVIHRLMIQVALTGVLFGFLLHYGYNFTRRELWSGYDHWGAIIYATVACAAALSRLPATRRRLLFFWKVSHEPDYAQRRQRTLLLKS